MKIVGVEDSSPGYKMKALNIDFEVWSPLSVKNVGAWKHASHPDAWIMCAGYSLDGGATIKQWIYGEEYPTDLLNAIAEGWLIRAWNADYERAIFECLGRRYGWPVPKIEQYRCSMAVSAYCAYPLSLELAAIAVNSPEKKSSNKPLLAILRNPNKPKKVYEDMYAYNIQDVKTEISVLSRLPVQEIPKTEQKIWEINSIINSKGTRIDLPMAKGAVKISGIITAQLQERIFDTSNGAISSLSQVKRICEYVSEHGYPLDNLQKDTVLTALKSNSLPTTCREILKARKTLGQSSIAKYSKMLDCADERGIIRGVLQYHVATTGRFGGRLVQLQNLPRPKIKFPQILDRLCPAIARADVESLSIFGDVFSILSSALRLAVIPPRGLDLLGADYSSIEAVVLGWLAEEPFYNNAFKNDLDLYRIMAQSVYGRKYEDITEEQRWLGKTLILGLGYQMSEKKLIMTVENNGTKITPELEALLIKGHSTYRNNCREITRFWGDINKVCREVLVSKTPRRLKKLGVSMHKECLTIQLPSGRKIWYPGACLKPHKNKWTGEIQSAIHFWSVGANNKWVEDTTYGGKLTENIVQAISRDILCHAVTNLHQKGFRIPFHIHDEILAYADKKDLPEFTNTILELPDWAKGLKLKCKSHHMTRFQK